nr:uncharacterized protein LOC109190628 [Ipomoea batatas]
MALNPQISEILPFISFPPVLDSALQSHSHGLTAFCRLHFCFSGLRDARRSSVLRFCARWFFSSPVLSDARRHDGPPASLYSLARRPSANHCKISESKRKGVVFTYAFVVVMTSHILKVFGLDVFILQWYDCILVLPLY